MATNRKPPNTAKATVWTATSRAQMEGPTNAIVYYIFMMVPKDQRAQLLNDLADWHDANQDVG